MSAEFYNEMAATASKLIDQFGADMTVYGPPGAADPVTGAGGGATTIGVGTRGMRSSFPAALVDGTRILATDPMFILQPGVEPVVGGQIAFGGSRWNVESVRVSAPSGIPLVYFVQGRK